MINENKKFKLHCKKMKDSWSGQEKTNSDFNI